VARFGSRDHPRVAEQLRLRWTTPHPPQSTVIHRLCINNVDNPTKKVETCG